MSIIWQYLDKRGAAVRALKDYGSMAYIIKNTESEIGEVRDRTAGTGGICYDGMPHAHNPKAGEDRLVKGIDEIDVLKERYRQAVEYMEWFAPAWQELSEDEKYVLETFYLSDGCQTGAVYDICGRFHIERSSAYNKKNRALEHLTTLLFGKA